MQDIDQDQVTGLRYNIIEEHGYSALLESEDKYYIAGQTFAEFRRIVKMSVICRSNHCPGKGVT